MEYCRIPPPPHHVSARSYIQRPVRLIHDISRFIIDNSQRLSLVVAMFLAPFPIRTDAWMALPTGMWPDGKGDGPATLCLTILLSKPALVGGPLHYCAESHQTLTLRTAASQADGAYIGGGIIQTMIKGSLTKGTVFLIMDEGSGPRAQPAISAAGHRMARRRSTGRQVPFTEDAQAQLLPVYESIVKTCTSTGT